MGNSPFVNAGSTDHPKLQDYIVVMKLAERKSLMRNKMTGKEIVMVENTFATEEQLNDFLKINNNALSISHQFYLNVFDHQILSLSNICSKQYKLMKYYPFEKHTLLQEINNRKTINKHFLVKEVWSILCSCVLVMAHFTKHDVLHYTLNPSDIIIDSNGACKIISPDLSDFTIDLNDANDGYYAPETLKFFKNQYTANGVNLKSGVFTLGMTLLHMLTLKQVRHLYCYDSYTLNVQDLQHMVANVEDLDLQIILKKMLKIHTYERIAFTQLQEMLFQVIARTQRDTDSHFNQNLNQTEDYQISRLQESIYQIKGQDTNPSSNSHSKVTYSKFQMHAQHSSVSETAIITNLVQDFQDIPQEPASHFISSFEDLELLDEEEHTQNDSFVGLPEITQDTNNNKTETFINNLMEKSNISNSKASDQTQFKFGQKDKENVDLLRNIQFEKPVYVSQILAGGRYQGYKLRGERHGFGTFYYHVGGKYSGEWVRNKMQGRGALYYISQKLAYEGQWRADKLDGYGVLYNENTVFLNKEYDYSHLENLCQEWIKYDGYFQGDVKSGEGTLHLSNGERFKGHFENDLPHGFGAFTTSKGSTVNGIWLMGALNQLVQ